MSKYKPKKAKSMRKSITNLKSGQKATSTKRKSKIKKAKKILDFNLFKSSNFQDLQTLKLLQSPKLLQKLKSGKKSSRAKKNKLKSLRLKTTESETIASNKKLNFSEAMPTGAKTARRSKPKTRNFKHLTKHLNVLVSQSLKWKPMKKKNKLKMRKEAVGFKEDEGIVENSQH